MGVLSKAMLAGAVTGAAATWSVISGNVGSGATGLACFDQSTCIIASSDGFLGYNIYRSDDGGKTWPTTVPNQDGYIFPMFDAAAYGSFAAVAGQFSAQFSLNKAQFFNTSLGGGGGVYARVIGTNSGFGLAGTFGNTNGVAVSTDSGLTFTAVDASLAYPAQAAAFVDTTTWYALGGLAPSGGSDQPSDQPTTGTTTTGTGSTTGTTTIASEQYFIRRVTPGVEFHTVGGKTRHVFNYPESEVALPAGGRRLQSNSSWAAQISATTDGGKTWTSQFNVAGQFILLGIDCLDAQHCVAAGASTDATYGGAYLLTTTNGGATWNQTYYDNTAGAQLSDVRAGPSANEYWAIGGVVTSSAISAEFVHSTDGGQTWTVDTTLQNYFGTGIEGSVGSSTPFLATLVDANDNTVVAALS